MGNFPADFRRLAQIFGVLTEVGSKVGRRWRDCAIAEQRESAGIPENESPKISAVGAPYGGKDMGKG